MIHKSIALFLLTASLGTSSFSFAMTPSPVKNPAVAKITHRDFALKTDYSRLHNMAFANAPLGLATAGNNKAGKTLGTIFATSDSGKSWKKVLESEKTLFTQIKFVPNSQTAWAAGVDTKDITSKNLGPLQRSTDGGQNWISIDPRAKLPHLDSEVLFTDLDVTDTNHVWVSTPKSILFSSDAGSTWKRWQVADAEVHTTIIGLNVLDNQTAYLALELRDPTSGKSQRRVMQSSDGGASWSSAFDSKIAKHDDEFVFASNRKDQFFMNTAERGVVNHSIDAGHSWNKVSFPSDPGFIRNIEFKDRDHGFVLGTRGFFVTQDAGATWTMEKGDDNGAHMNFTASDSDHVWLFGAADPVGK